MKHTVTSAVELAQRFLQLGDAVLEIGAADGAYTRVYADRVGPTGSVLAVEPHRGHLKTLRGAYAAMPWVTIWPGAVGASIGERLFQTDQTYPKQSSFWAKNVAVPGEAYPVAVTTIDALVRTMPRAPKLIQVDAQGAEAAILGGAVKTLALPIVWVIELWATGLRRAGASVKDVLRPFQDHAYTPRTLQGQRLGWDTADRTAVACVGASHIDLVMVPEDLMEADW